jgi:hypothetical protein
VLLDTFAIPRVYKVVENTSYEDQQSQNTDDAQETRESSGKVYMNKVAKKGVGVQSRDTNTQSYETGKTSETSSHDSTVKSSDISYESDDTSITLTTYREYDTDIYVADVTLSGSARIETAFAQNAYDLRHSQPHLEPRLYITWMEEVHLQCILTEILLTIRLPTVGI